MSFYFSHFGKIHCSKDIAESEIDYIQICMKNSQILNDNYVIGTMIQIQVNQSMEEICMLEVSTGIKEDFSEKRTSERKFKT